VARLPKELIEELNKNYIGVPELSRITGRSARGLQYHIANGTLPALKVDNPSMAGYKFMIDKDDAAQFLEDHGEPIPHQLEKEVPATFLSVDEVVTYESIKRGVAQAEAGQLVSIDLKETFIDRVKTYFLTVFLAVTGKI